MNARSCLCRLTLLFYLSTLQAADPAFAPFFPFCINWHDSQKKNFEQQAEMLKELGYPGVGHIWLEKIKERLKAFDAAGMKVYQITMTVECRHGG